MKPMILVPFLFLFTSLDAKAQLNPYQIGMQYCSMVDSGISREKAWDYIIENIATGAVNNSYAQSGDPYAPWSPRRTLGGSIGMSLGAGISQGVIVGSQLKKMRPDIDRVIASNCPSGRIKKSKSASTDSWKSVDSMTSEDYEALNNAKITDPITKGVVGVGVMCTYTQQQIQQAADSGDKNSLAYQKSDDCRITKIINNTPAYKDGRLRVGDKIVEVNGTKIKQIIQEDVVKLIGGEPGTYATILVEGNPSPIVIKRAKASLFKQ